MITTTLKDLRKCGACTNGYNKLVAHLSGKPFNPHRKTYMRFKYEQPIPILTILASNGPEDAVWAIRASNATPAQCRLLAAKLARSVQHLLTDQRSLDALDTAEKQATDEELSIAENEAWQAVMCSNSWDASWAVWYAVDGDVWQAYRHALKAGSTNLEQILTGELQ